MNNKFNWWLIPLFLIVIFTSCQRKTVSNIVQLTTVDVSDNPVSLPVRDYLAIAVEFDNEKGYQVEVYLLDITTSLLIRIGQVPGANINRSGHFNARAIRWSPDATQILLNQETGLSGHASTVFKADGSARSEFIRNKEPIPYFPWPGGHIGTCNWSPDSQYIVCTSILSRLSSEHWFLDVYDATDWSIFCHEPPPYTPPGIMSKEQDCLPLLLDNHQWWHYWGPEIGWQITKMKELNGPLPTPLPTPVTWLVEQGEIVIWSPDGNYLGWVETGKLHVSNIQDKTVVIYELKDAKIIDFDWSPLYEK